MLIIKLSVDNVNHAVSVVKWRQNDAILKHLRKFFLEVNKQLAE